MRNVLWLMPVVLLFATLSCDPEPEFIPTPEPARAEPAASTSFNPATCGRINGRVIWSGERPAPVPFLFGVPGADGNFATQMIPNPNAPVIGLAPGGNFPNPPPLLPGVANAVVFLRGIDPSRSKPWDHPPVRVEMKDRNIRVIQGEAAGRVGFVRRGDSVEMKSAEPAFHILRARGAAFFSLTFPQPEQPLVRTFDTAGRVELSSGAGFYWASADLFVTDHPYWTRTDAEGGFTFENVPPSSFEVVAWLPGWDVTKQERDPETGLVFRQTYGPPKESCSPVAVQPKSSVHATLQFGK